MTGVRTSTRALRRQFCRRNRFVTAGRPLRQACHLIADRSSRGRRIDVLLLIVRILLVVKGFVIQRAAHFGIFALVSAHGIPEKSHDGRVFSLSFQHRPKRWTLSYVYASAAKLVGRETFYW